MDLRGREEGDFEVHKRVDEYNKEVLEPYVVGVVAKDEEAVMNMLQQSPELEGWRTATMLTDSRGQQKAYLQHTSLVKSEEDLAAEMEEKLSLKAAQTAVRQRKKEARKERSQFDKAREAYLESEVDFNEYL